MYSALLKNVNGAVVVELPFELLQELQVAAGDPVQLRVDSSSLALSRLQTPRYTLDELLSQCDFSIPPSVEEREWLDAPAVGREVI